MRSATNRILAAFIPAALGAGAAIAVAALMSSDAPEVDAGSVAVARTPDSGAPASRRPRAPSPRGAGSWSPRDTAVDIADEDVTVDDESVPPFASPEEEYDSLLAGRTHHESRWRAESVDIGWARAAQSSVRSDLERIAEDVVAQDASGFEVEDVACRSTMCVAKIEWASANEAVEHAERIAMARFDQSCGIFLLGPSPDAFAKGAAFTQEVFFDCGERAT
jgi:hypothetical protein